MRGRVILNSIQRTVCSKFKRFARSIVPRLFRIDVGRRFRSLPIFKLTFSSFKVLLREKTMLQYFDPQMISEWLSKIAKLSSSEFSFSSDIIPFQNGCNLFLRFKRLKFLKETFRSCYLQIAGMWLSLICKLLEQLSIAIDTTNRHWLSVNLPFRYELGLKGFESRLDPEKKLSSLH